MDGEVSPTDSPISRTDGGYPVSRMADSMHSRIWRCRAVSWCEVAMAELLSNGCTWTVARGGRTRQTPVLPRRGRDGGAHLFAPGVDAGTGVRAECAEQAFPSAAPGFVVTPPREDVPMAAVIVPSPQPRPAFGSAPLPVARPVGRPALRVLPGGRSSQAMAATYRRRRLVAGLLLVTVLAVGWLRRRRRGRGGRPASPLRSRRRSRARTVVVEAGPGDTLWTLAREVHPAGDVRPAGRGDDRRAVAGRRSRSAMRCRIPAG